MDPYSRRFTWDIIRSRRSSAIPESGQPPPSHPAVILTTHSMEEAEALADDVVVMADGRVAAQGSILELKQRFGAGYTLSLALAASSVDLPQMEAAPESLSALVVSHVPLAIPLHRPFGVERPHEQQRGGAVSSGAAARGAPSSSREAPGVAPGLELSFRLPKECVSQFPALLRQLDALGPESGVSGYGLSETTLEEVFHTITSQAHTATAQQQGMDQQNTGSSHIRSLDASPQHGCLQQPLQGHALRRQQLMALLYKRALIASRDRLSVLTQLLVPLLLVYLALWVQGMAAHPRAQHPLTLSRAAALRGAQGVLAASASARQEQGLLDLFLLGFSSPTGPALQDCGSQSLYQPKGDLGTSLEGFLLSRWHSGSATYDALFLERLVAPVGGSAVDGVQLVLLINQTAVHALPAAVNQASTALLRQVNLISARGGHLFKEPPRTAAAADSSITCPPRLQVPRPVLRRLLIQGRLRGKSICWFVSHHKERVLSSRRVSILWQCPFSHPLRVMMCSAGDLLAPPSLDFGARGPHSAAGSRPGARPLLNTGSKCANRILLGAACQGEDKRLSAPAGFDRCASLGLLALVLGVGPCAICLAIGRHRGAHGSIPRLPVSRAKAGSGGGAARWARGLGAARHLPAAEVVPGEGREGALRRTASDHCGSFQPAG